MASRFKDLDVSVEDFISEQENESTKKKTLQNVYKNLVLSTELIM